MKVIHFILVICLASKVMTEETDWRLTTKNGIVVLPMNDFDKYRASNPYFFVEFMFENCPHCNGVDSFMRNINSLNEKNASRIPIIQIDIGHDVQFRKDHNITALPAFYLYIHGHQIPYHENLEQNNLNEWIDKTIEKKPSEITSVSALQRILKSTWSVLLFLDQKDQKLLNDFTALSALYSKIKFYFTDLDEASSLAQSPDPYQLIVFRDSDEEKVVLSDKTPFKFKDMHGFIESAKFSTVIEFSEENTMALFSRGIPIIMLFLDGKDDTLSRAFKNVSKDYQNKFNFAKVSLSEGIGERLSQHFGFTKKDSGAVLMTVPSGTDWEKYRLDGIMSEENLRSFIENHLSGNLDKHYRSEPVPTQNDKMVKRAVGKTFEELILQTTENVFLLITSTNCSECLQIENDLENLAYKLRKVSDLKFVKINLIVNEHPKLKAMGFPTAKLYKKNEKENPIDFVGILNFDGIHGFLRDKLKEQLDLDLSKDLDIDEEL